MGDAKWTFEWLQNIRMFSQSIRDRGLAWESDWTYSPRLKNPIKVTPKKKKNYSGKCRVLALYELSDTVIASCFAGYLRDKIDPHLNAHCFAFRSAQGAEPPTHHHAIAAIQAYRQRFDASQELWVSECDIEGFFDAVSHDVIRSEFLRIQHQFGLSLDKRLLGFVESFLTGYSYTSFAVPRAYELLAKKKVLKPKIPDPVRSLEKLGLEGSSYHGIPQGSSLSCIIANIVLSSADDIVCGIIGKDGFYARYCDDIIIIHPDKRICQDALDAYLKRLSELKLPFHKPEGVTKYGRAFWKGKSKSPYKWAEAKGPSSPWLAFVGYQINRAGTLRVRKSSIEKEISKQGDALRRIFTQLKNRLAGRKSIRVPGSIRHRTHLHLISFGVGIPHHQFNSVSNGPSWAKGFKELGLNGDTFGIRRLDQARVRTMRRLNRHIMHLTFHKKLRFSPARIAEKKEARFFGKPFSYFQQFTMRTSKAPTNYTGAWDGVFEY